MASPVCNTNGPALRERVALAIEVGTRRFGSQWGRIAAAAMSAMRRPSTRMLDAAERLGYSRSDAQDLWQAMFYAECRWLIPEIEAMCDETSDALDALGIEQ